jgi:hypothetical protein
MTARERAGVLDEKTMAEIEAGAQRTVKARAELDAVNRQCGLPRVPPSKDAARILALVAEVRRLRAASAEAYERAARLVSDPERLARLRASSAWEFVQTIEGQGRLIAAVLEGVADEVRALATKEERP